MKAEKFKKDFNRIKILPKHYLQAEVKVEVALVDPFTKEEHTHYAYGRFVRHREDFSLTIFFN